MKLFAVVAVAAATLISVIPTADAQTKREDLTGYVPPAGIAAQMGDLHTNMDRDRIANELSGNFAVRDRRGRLLNPGQIMAGAKSAAQGAGLSCQVKEAGLIGVTEDNNDLFEVACQTGTGYIVSGPKPTQLFDCMTLATQAEQMKADGHTPPANATCRLKGNQNAVAIVAGYAKEASVPCEVDAGILLGGSAYEVGCVNADGYIIERDGSNGAWTKAPCWKMAASNDGACRYSTAAESNSAWTEILSGTEAASCKVEKARQVGIDSQKLIVYEVKCSSTPGYLARVNAAGKAERVHACADPATAGIAGGCTLP